jgi:hypothetical protein
MWDVHLVSGVIVKFFLTTGVILRKGVLLLNFILSFFQCQISNTLDLEKDKCWFEHHLFTKKSKQNRRLLHFWES